MTGALEVARSRWLDGSLVTAPGVYDAFSSLLAQRAGYRVAYLGGNALGLHLGVGQPFVTSTETLASLQSIRRVSSIPVLVDAGAGFGDPVHAALTMRSLEAAGAAAVQIDDQIYPKRAHYHRGRSRLAATSDVSDKLAAMSAARRGADSLLIARTDALRAGASINETIDRCLSYVDAGAEALIVLDLMPDQVAAFRERLGDVPLFWIGGIDDPVPDTESLARAGFAAALYPFLLIGSAFDAMREALRALEATGRPTAAKSPVRLHAREALEAIGFDTLVDIERKTTERGEHR